MQKQTDKAVKTLAASITERLNQLGMSRRELSRRTGLSRQTIHNIEKEGNTNIRPSTLKAIDEALHWEAGTALSYALGKGADMGVTHERVLAYVSQIALRLTHMSTEQLELCLIMMEENELGQANHSTEEFKAAMERMVEGWSTQLEQLRKQTRKHVS
jgi:transcriptional regulator with XRE-family HTH domain